MKKLLTCLLLIYSLFLMACPKESVVRKSATASHELAGITLDVVNAVGKAYDAGIFSLAAKDRIAMKLKSITSGGKRFNALVEVWKDAATIPADKLSILNVVFSDEVVTPFLEILQELKVLSPSQATYVHTAIAALRAAILIISGTFADAGYPHRELNYV